MNVATARIVLLVLALAGAAATSAALLQAGVRVSLPSAQRSNRPAIPEVLKDSVVERLIGGALDRPAFRADRRAPSAGYRPEQPETPPVPETPKPTLAISGIVWGREPAAVVEGLPGIEGSAVLRKGDSAAGVRVVAIDSLRVVIRGLDTTWRLAVRQPWQ